jgi:hypothetical protein
MYLSGLGVSVGDLPRGGNNLRLYTYDAPGSKYNPTQPGTCGNSGWSYNTGHYDLSLPGGPCSQTDAQGFCNWQSLSNYAGGRGEMLVLVNRDDLPALCSAQPTAPAPSPAPAIITPGIEPPPPAQPIAIPLRPIGTPAPPPTVIISTPGGSGYPIPPPPGGTSAPSDGGGLPPLQWVLIGAGVLLLLARR